MVVTYTPEQEKQTRDLLAKGDQLGQQAAAKTGVTYNPAYTPAATPVVSSEGAVSATAITPAPQVSLPQPTAPAAQQQFQLGLETSAQQARATVDDTLKTQRDDAIKRQEDAAARLQTILSESDPTKRATYAQEQRIVQQQLDSAEVASRTVTQDFESRRRIVGELETLLNDGNNLIKQQLGLPVGQRVVAQRASQAIQDVQARAGVLQAVVAGLDGNISLAHTLIDTAGSAIRAQWQDSVAYNNAVLQLAANKELAIEGEHKKYAEEQLGMAKSKLDGIEKTIARIKDAMIDPETARDFADAGITLNDSVQEINTKLGEQVRRREDRAQSEALALDALQNGAPADIAARMRTAKTVEEAMRIGGHFVGAIARQQAYSAMANAALSRRVSLIALAKEGDPQAIKELGYDPSNVPLSTDEIIANENAFSDIQKDIDKLDAMKSNGSGLRASSGLFRGSLTPWTASNKSNFLADAQYIVKNLTFEKLSSLKERGVNLTPISEKELKAVGEASSVLASAARYDEAGNLEGFKIPEQRVYELLGEVRGHMFNAQQELNIDLGLTKGEQSELVRVLTGSQQ